MKRKRIFIVDDEIGCTRVLKANLEMTGLYEVAVENRPENAVPVARQFKPDLVLLDVVMPHMSGAAVAEAFLGDPELRSMGIAFLTAADHRLLSVKTSQGIDGLPRINKPASMEEILRFLEEYFSLRTIPRATAPDEPGQTLGENYE